MPTQPPITLKIDLIDIVGGVPVRGSVSIMLCNYGSALPSLPGISSYGRVLNQEIDADTTGTVTVGLWGNDYIQPAGTYYVVAIQDASGNTIQAAAYYLTGSGTQNLRDLPALDPETVAFPMATPPPTLGNNLLDLGTVQGGFVIDGSTYTTQQMILAGDATPTFQAMVPGEIYVFRFQQDGQGGHRLYWPQGSQFLPAMNPLPNGYTVQALYSDADGALHAVAPVVYGP